MSSRKSEILHFDGFFLAKSYKVSAKKGTEDLSLTTLKSDGKLKEKQICGFKYCMTNLVNYHPTTQKSSIPGTEQCCKIGIISDVVASKMTWEIGELSLEHSKVWKIVLWLAPFVQSIHIFRWKSKEVLCLMTLMQYLTNNWLVVWKIT